MIKKYSRNTVSCVFCSSIFFFFLDNEMVTTNTHAMAWREEKKKHKIFMLFWVETHDVMLLYSVQEMTTRKRCREKKIERETSNNERFMEFTYKHTYQHWMCSTTNHAKAKKRKKCEMMKNWKRASTKNCAQTHSVAA